MYQQSANPNATNSELDAKKIVKNVQLTSAQRDELIEQFVEIQVDSMDHQSLYELATEYITNSFDRLTDSEIKERIESLYDEELYDELVDNVNIEDEDAKLQHLEEIKYLVDILKLNNDELMIEEETELSSNLYLKLRNISKACTCKEDAK